MDYLRGSYFRGSEFRGLLSPIQFYFNCLGLVCSLHLELMSYSYTHYDTNQSTHGKHVMYLVHNILFCEQCHDVTVLLIDDTTIYYCYYE